MPFQYHLGVTTCWDVHDARGKYCQPVISLLPKINSSNCTVSWSTCFSGGLASLPTSPVFFLPAYPPVDTWGPGSPTFTSKVDMNRATEGPHARDLGTQGSWKTTQPKLMVSCKVATAQPSGPLPECWGLHPSMRTPALPTGYHEDFVLGPVLLGY